MLAEWLRLLYVAARHTSAAGTTGANIVVDVATESLVFDAIVQLVTDLPGVLL